MKQGKINKAYNSLMELSQLKFQVKKSRDIYKLTNILKEIFEFGSREEIKIIQTLKGEINENGSISFNGDNKKERAQSCSNELCQLYESEVDIDFIPIILTETDLGNQTISAADIDNLEGFIIFE